jgi:type IV pilus assembly protein PilM
MKLPIGIPQLTLNLPRFLGGRSGGGEVVGLDIQPGFVAAVQARVNGSILAERAVSVDLAADTVRDGEVLDEVALTEALRALFRDSGLGKRVRIGVANQRTVLRTLELPPVTDQKELAAAVMFQAQDQVPMPLNNAVLDFHALGIVDTPAGPRQRVVLVAAQRDMIERLLSAVRNAGLTPEGVDLSAFALIRSLYKRDTEDDARVLYLNVDGLTNLAIAEGTVCRFTRVVGSGLEGMAAELAERRGIALADARALLAAVDLRQGAPAGELVAEEAVLPEPEPATAPEPEPEPEPQAPLAPESAHSDSETAGEDGTVAEPASEHADADAQDAPQEPVEEPVEEPVADAEPGSESGDEYDYAYELGHGYEETAAAASGIDLDVWNVLENGIRDIAGEVRNSLDFHRSQDGGGEVSHVVLSGAAEEIPGFAESLQLALGVEVRPESVGAVDGRLSGGVSQHRLAVATGLSAREVPQ